MANSISGPERGSKGGYFDEMAVGKPQQIPPETTDLPVLTGEDLVQLLSNGGGGVAIGIWGGSVDTDAQQVLDRKNAAQEKRIATLAAKKQERIHQNRVAGGKKAWETRQRNAANRAAEAQYALMEARDTQREARSDERQQLLAAFYNAYLDPHGFHSPEEVLEESVSLPAADEIIYPAAEASPVNVEAIITTLASDSVVRGLTLLTRYGVSTVSEAIIAMQSMMRLPGIQSPHTSKINKADRDILKAALPPNTLSYMGLLADSTEYSTLRKLVEAIRNRVPKVVEE